MKLSCYGALALIAFLIHGAAPAAAQQQDTAGRARVFTLQDFEELVFRNHPVVKQAGLLTEAAKAGVLTSLGYFDPAVKAAFGRKYFGGTNYYNNWSSELKVPLWLAGADLKLGYDRNIGNYTNPETRTATSGLSGVGLSIPIGQGLLIDARRNTLRQSKIMVNYAEAERLKEINTTLYTAIKDYWNWYYAYRQYELINEGLRLARQRYEAISGRTEAGDAPGIDSVEANITVLDRRMQLEKVKNDLQNARLVLSNHLWNENGDPLELPEQALPQAPLSPKLDNALIDMLISQSVAQHPELLKLRAKGGQLAVERSYRAELLKPKMNISGSLLANRTGFNEYVPDYYDFRWGNYKVGLEFSFPLFLRAERGKLREVKIKQQELALELQQSGRVIQNEVQASYNTLKAYEAQLEIQVDNINNQQLLLTGESQKFELGESNLFMINSRESKLIDMKIKREEMVMGFQKTLAELYYKAGMRPVTE